MTNDTTSDEHLHQNENRQDVSPKDLVEALHTTFGKHNARAIHAKGLIFEGTFVPSKEAHELTKAPHLQNQESKVLVRFSDFTGIPNIADNDPDANPRGLGIKFILPDESTTDIVAASYNGFPVATSEEFKELLLAIATTPDKEKKGSPLDLFFESHPIAKTFLTTQKISASFASINYFGVNSFKFINNEDNSKFIRYQFISESGEQFLSTEEAKEESSEYLFTEIKERIKQGSIKFKLYAQIAEEGDKIEDPSIAWPDSRQRVLLGEITVTKLSKNTKEEDKSFAVNPGNIPEGIEIADPMLQLRAKSYPISVEERQ